MVVLAIWLFLLGYTVTITGKRNLGLAYKPQADGSIKAVDAQGNQARTFTLMDVITCAGASGQLQGQAPSSSPATPVTPSVPAAPSTRLQPQPRLSPAAVPALAPRITIPGIQLPRVPTALPPLLPPEVADELERLDRSVSGAVYDGLNGLINALRKVKMPSLQPSATPGLGPRPGLVP